MAQEGGATVVLLDALEADLLGHLDCLVLIARVPDDASLHPLVQRSPVQQAISLLALVWVGNSPRPLANTLDDAHPPNCRLHHVCNRFVSTIV